MSNPMQRVPRARALVEVNETELLRLFHPVVERQQFVLLLQLDARVQRAPLSGAVLLFDQAQPRSLMPGAMKTDETFVAGWKVAGKCVKVYAG